MKRNILNSYKYYYEKASIFPQQLDKKEIQKFSSIVKNDTTYKVLDIGCAEGRLAIKLAKQGHDITVADISEKQLNKVKNNSKNLNIKTIHCDIEQQINSLQNDQFDYIFFMDIIEHLRNPMKALENIRPLLKQSGKLIIHTPNSTSLYKFIRYFLMPRRRKNFYDLNKLGNLHLQSYDYLTIEQTLNFSGLKVKKIIPTKLSFPFFNRFKIFNPLFKCYAFIFPMLADTLLLICEKTEPINVDDLIENWKLRFKN